MLAGAAALAGIACAVAVAVQSDPAALAGALGAMLFAVMATLAALWAIWPIDVELPGWDPSAFENDWSKPELDVLQEMLPVLQGTIDKNNQVLETLMRRSLRAMLLIAGTPFAAAMGWGFFARHPGGVMLALACLGVICTATFLHFVPERLRTPR